MDVDRSRRRLLLIGSMFCLYPTGLFAAGKRTAPSSGLHSSLTVLHESRHGELTAHDHYVAFTSTALAEHFANIAYMFTAFAHSEKIHARNYRQLLEQMGETVTRPHFKLQLGDTRANLRLAARNELTKIESSYPDFLQRLAAENWQPALRACRHSWLCHQQHSDHIKRIDSYAGWFFNQVAAEIEKSPFDFHVCESCGSTLAHPPEGECGICEQPAASYQRITRPKA